MKKNRLHAPGRVTLSGLELSTGKTFMGMPREAVVAMMKDKKGQITADFVLEGNIDDPKFSLNENSSARSGRQRRTCSASASKAWRAASAVPVRELPAASAARSTSCWGHASDAVT